MKLLKYTKSKAAILLLLCFVCFFSVPLVSQNGKNSKRQLELKKKRLNDEIRQINAQLNATKATKKSSIGTLVSINVKLKKREELIRMINLEISLLDKQIEHNQIQVKQLQATLEKLKAEYARMIVFAQRNRDSYNALMFIFAAESFNQAYARMKYIQQYSEFRRRQAAEITNTQTILLAKLNELRNQQREKQGLLGSEQQQQSTLSTEKRQQEQVLNDLQRKEKELKATLEKKKKDAAEMQLAIKKLIAEEIRRKAEEARKRAEAKRLAEKKAREEREREARKKGVKVEPEKTATAGASATGGKMVPELSEAALALSANFATNRGKLPWPVNKGVICEQYGRHEHPAIKGFIVDNNGIEICCEKGTQARAVFDGEVTGIALSPAGGKLVIVRHGEYLSVYSNLDDVNVKTGQKIKVKDVIGSVLYDSEQGRGQIGFQIWKEQKTMDPEGWLLGAR